MLYAIILFWLVYSIDTIKEEYIEKFNKRLDELQTVIDEKIDNDEKFFENADYYKNSFDTIIKNQAELADNLSNINDYIKKLEEEWIKVYTVIEE